MKHLKNITLVLGAVLLIPLSSSARRGIPVGEREVLNQVYDFPDNEDYQLDNGHYMDLATLHKEFNIAYALPLYVTQEPKLVAFDKETEQYMELEDADMDAILKENKIEKADMLKLPFYTRYGGKGVALVILAIIGYGMMPSRSKNNVTPKKL